MDSSSHGGDTRCVKVHHSPTVLWGLIVTALTEVVTSAVFSTPAVICLVTISRAGSLSRRQEYHETLRFANNPSPLERVAACKIGKRQIKHRKRSIDIYPFMRQNSDQCPKVPKMNTPRHGIRKNRKYKSLSDGARLTKEEMAGYHYSNREACDGIDSRSTRRRGVAVSLSQPFKRDRPSINSNTNVRVHLYPGKRPGLD